VDDSPEVIRHQMEETRASLSEKLELLEQQVKETVHEAKSAVHETVDTVKDAVHEAVDTVKDAFDVQRQFRRHPWAMLGGSIALGFLGGKLLEKSEPDRPRAGDWPHAPHWSHGPFAGQPNGEAREPRPGERAADKASPDDGVWSSLTSRFGPEIDRLKGMAVGAALGVVRDIITQSLPEPMKPQMADVVDNITAKLGGTPMRGPLLSEGDSDEKCNPAEMGRAMGPT